MQTPVVCKNCGLKWMKVTTWGNDTEFTEDLQNLCPNCGSNWYEIIPVSKDTEEVKDG
jgi:Zn finger protein HypA/HybF involved in hydrogenase expression